MGVNVKGHYSVNKKVRLLFSIVGMTAFGFCAAELAFNSIVNGKYTGLVSALDIISIPVKAVFGLVHAISGTGVGGYIKPYLFATVLYFAGIGFLLGRLLYSVIHKVRIRKKIKSPSGQKNPTSFP